jgi:hypothetical protein
LLAYLCESRSDAGSKRGGVAENFWKKFICDRKDSKAAGPVRKYLVEFEHSEKFYLVTCDRIKLKKDFTSVLQFTPRAQTIFYCGPTDDPLLGQYLLARITRIFEIPK